MEKDSLQLMFSKISTNKKMPRPCTPKHLTKSNLIRQRSLAPGHSFYFESNNHFSSRGSSTISDEYIGNDSLYHDSLQRKSARYFPREEEYVYSNRESVATSGWSGEFIEGSTEISEDDPRKKINSSSFGGTILTAIMVFLIVILIVGLLFFCKMYCCGEKFNADEYTIDGDGNLVEKEPQSVKNDGKMDCYAIVGIVASAVLAVGLIVLVSVLCCCCDDEEEPKMIYRYRYRPRPPEDSDGRVVNPDGSDSSDMNDIPSVPPLPPPIVPDGESMPDSNPSDSKPDSTNPTPTDNDNNDGQADDNGSTQPDNTTDDSNPPPTLDPTAPQIRSTYKCGAAVDTDYSTQNENCKLQLYNTTNDTNQHCYSYGGALDPCALHQNNDTNDGINKSPATCGKDTFFLWDEPDTQGTDYVWAAIMWKRYADKFETELKSLREKGVKITTPLLRANPSLHENARTFFNACGASCSDVTSKYYIDIIAVNVFCMPPADLNTCIGGANWTIDQVNQIPEVADGSRKVYVTNWCVLGDVGTPEKQYNAMKAVGQFFEGESPIERVYWFTATGWGLGEPDEGNRLSKFVASEGKTLGELWGEICKAL